jgi:hypothetical protein
MLTCSPVVVDRILYSRSTGTETWLTSDGRAYLVQLYEYSEDDMYSTDTDQASMDVSFHSLYFVWPSEVAVPSERAYTR